MSERLPRPWLTGLCCAVLLTFPWHASGADAPVQSGGVGVVLPDPLRPAIMPAAAPAGETGAPAAVSFVLQAIRVGSGGRYAVINDERLRPGDRVGDAVVVHIDVHSVRLLRDDHAVLDIAFEAPGMNVRRLRSNR